MKNIYLLFFCFKIINSCWTWDSDKCTKFTSESDCEKEKSCAWGIEEMLVECDCEVHYIKKTNMVCRTINEKRLKLNIIFYLIICLFFVF